MKGFMLASNSTLIILLNPIVQSPLHFPSQPFSSNLSDRERDLQEPNGRIEFALPLRTV